MSAVTVTATVTASARSILGPLLTTFTPPSAYASYGGPSSNLENGYRAQGCFDATVVDEASCWPSASVSAPTPRLNGWGFYSPGTVCPSGYAVSCGAGFIASAGNAVSTSLSVPPSFDFQFPLAAGETAVGCCPEGFACYKFTDSQFQTCISRLTSGSFDVGCCDTTAGRAPLASFQPVVVPSDVTVTVNPSNVMGGEVSTATLHAPLFQVNWQATDTGGVAAPPVVTTSSSSSSSSSGAAGSTSSTSSTPPTPTSRPSSGLSTGAKVAIGVVVPIAVLALLGALGFWLLRRRRRNRMRAAEASPMAMTAAEHFAPPPAPKPELDAASSRQELESPRPELRGDRGYRPTPQELGS